MHDGNQRWHRHHRGSELVNHPSNMQPESMRVSLFIPCLVDQVYPEIGLAMARVLERLGFELHYDQRQTCCGQPAFNAGHASEARIVAEHFVDVFREAEVIVGPSGSCTAMVRHFYSRLFAGHPMTTEAADLSRRVFEFSEFLKQYVPADRIRGAFSAKVGFHNSCHSYRELGITDEHVAFLQHIRGLEWIRLPGEPVCCGFGGLFSFKFAPIAETMAKTRLDMFIEAGCDTLLSNDPGCIMHMRQEVQARDLPLRIMHLAELLDRAMA